MLKKRTVDAQTGKVQLKKPKANRLETIDS